MTVTSLHWETLSGHRGEIPNHTGNLAANPQKKFCSSAHLLR